MTPGRREYLGVLVLELAAAAALLLLATRTWVEITTPRARPLPPDHLALGGRALDAAPTACALVGLAGVVAVLATRGLARRVVGGLIAVAGVLALVRGLADLAAPGPARARALVRDHHATVSVPAGVVPHVLAHPVWAVLTCVAAVVLAVAGVLVALRSGRWAVLSARYDAPGGSGTRAQSPAGDRPPAAGGATAPASGTGRGTDATSGTGSGADTARGADAAPGADSDPEQAERTRLRAQAAMWTALDRGEDPTAADPRPGS